MHLVHDIRSASKVGSRRDQCVGLSVNVELSPICLTYELKENRLFLITTCQDLSIDLLLITY